ncbi:hypothetical protein HMI55_002374 [Coelomomyces lativittatus]|nr:hypothetical protein HMI55_002374 [Coelomomyces lativittatus]
MILGVDTSKLEELKLEVEKTKALYEAEVNSTKSLRFQLQIVQAELKHAEKRAQELQQMLSRFQSRESIPVLNGIKDWELLPSIKCPLLGAFRHVLPSADSEIIYLTRTFEHVSSIVGHSLHSDLTIDFGPLHTAPIRSLVRSTHHPDYFLTASLDKSATLFNSHSKAVMVKFQSQSQAWSAQFHSSNANLIYIGQQHHCIQLFDLRQPSSPIDSLTQPGPKQALAIHSLVHASNTLISGSFGSVVKWDDTPSLLAKNDCFAIESAARQMPSFALAFRGHKATHFSIFNVNEVKPTATCTIPVRNSLMFRFALWHEESNLTSNDVNDKPLKPIWHLASPNEASQGIDIFNFENETMGNLSCSLSSGSPSPLLDIKPMWTPEKFFLTSLNEAGEIFLFQKNTA